MASRRMLIAGNWKMNLLRQSAMSLIQDLTGALAGVSDVDIVVCPPSVYLAEVAQRLQGTNIGLGAQNAYSKSEGAYTGEVSCPMLADVGCRYVILGHSERRAIFGETDAMVNEKLFAALSCGLVPIVCVGETLEQRETGQTKSVITGQCQGSLAGLTADQMRSLVIAYEPVWAIGTGKTATPAQAEEVHAGIRRWLAETFSSETADGVVLQYGGSVKPDVVSELFAQPNVDGGLVGGASLKSDLFAAIVRAASELRN